MSGPVMIGPKNPTANTPMHYTFDAETVAIYVQNYTRFTLLVSFSATEPTATDSLNNQYDGVLAAGGRDVFYVQSRGATTRERGLNAIGAFSGSVWIMPIDRTGSQANVGTVSGINDLWVSGYGPYDPPPPITGGMPLNVDLSSQARVVAIPPPGSQALSGSWDPSIFNPLTINFVTLSATNIANLQACVYLFYFSLFPTATATPSSMHFQLQAQPQDSGHNAVGSVTTLFRATTYSYGTTTYLFAFPVVFSPYFPLAALVGYPSNARYLEINLVQTGGANIASDFNFALTADPNNLSFPPSYGGNSGPQRWGGQFTNQIGLW